MLTKSKHPEKFSNHLFVINDLSNTILKKIKDYEDKIHNGYQIKKDFYNIDFVYMHSILLDMAKLLSVTASDKSGLKQLKNISPKNIKDQIEDLENFYKTTIKKISNNRNRIISHVDISSTNSYFKMGFSKIEINRKLEDYKEYLKNTGASEKKDNGLVAKLKEMIATSPEDERYSPSDFYQDINIFKEIINKILVIAYDLNSYYYDK